MSGMAIADGLQTALIGYWSQPTGAGRGSPSGGRSTPVTLAELLCRTGGRYLVRLLNVARGSIMCRRAIAIKWTCGVVPGHSHDTEAEAEACIDRHTGSAPYGYCPSCGKRGYERERRPFGNDKCEGGHTYPSSEAK